MAIIKKTLDQKILDNRKVILQNFKNLCDDGLIYTHSKIILPYLTDDELLARYRRIKPIISIDNIYYYLKRYSVQMMRNSDYLLNVEKDIRAQVDMTDAETIAEFSCYHPYNFILFFKPTIAEVLQQFPDEILNDANAFYMTSSPQNKADFNAQSEIVKAGCHRSTIRALILLEKFELLSIWWN